MNPFKIFQGDEKEMKFLLFFLSFTWEGIQHLLALLCVLMLFVLKVTVKNAGLNGMTYTQCKLCLLINFRSSWLSSFSLGRFIFINELYHCNDFKVLKHEKGHSTQSLILGPLYLPLIGIPSILLNLIARFNSFVKSHYYSLYPENWADILGDVDRS